MTIVTLGLISFLNLFIVPVVGLTIYCRRRSGDEVSSKMDMGLYSVFVMGCGRIHLYYQILFRCQVICVRLFCVKVFRKAYISSSRSTFSKARRGSLSSTT